MENSLRPPSHTCQEFRILLFLFTVFVHLVSCVQGSLSSSEVAMGESYSGSNCTFKKFIMQSYFEKYESSADSNFQDFLADETFRSCKLLPANVKVLLTLLVPQRQLIGEGSHRHLSSIITFHFQPESISEPHMHFCKVIIIERLPRGVFADPFELQHLLQRGAFADIAIFGDTNLELPSFLSNQSVVEIHMNVGSNVLFGHMNQVEIRVDLPLHARYPPLDEGRYATVEIGAPDLFLHCSIEGNSDNESCLFKPIINNTESHPGAVVWRIPSGIRAHAGIVSAFTFLAAFMSTLSIVIASMFYSDIKFHRNSKQS